VNNYFWNLNKRIDTCAVIGREKIFLQRGIRAIGAACVSKALLPNIHTCRMYPVEDKKQKVSVFINISGPKQRTLEEDCFYMVSFCPSRTEIGNHLIEYSITRATITAYLGNLINKLPYRILDKCRWTFETQNTVVSDWRWTRSLTYETSLPESNWVGWETFEHVYGS